MTKRIVVTGAASGIGRAVALEIARRGWSVGVLDRDEDAAAEVAAEARAAGAREACAIVADVSSESAVEGAFEAAIERLGGIDGAVASAGIELKAPLVDLSIETWRRVLDVNLTGTFLTVRSAARHLQKSRRGGSIVCMSSPSAFVGFAGGANAAYGASKGGISALVRAAAIDLAPERIRVNAVVPGATDTPMLYFGLVGEDLSAERDRLRDAARQQIPLGRMAEPTEIAQSAAWLLTDESSYVTGSHLVCDGGLMAKSANDF